MTSLAALNGRECYNLFCSRILALSRQWVARSGMITHFPLLPARPHDIQLLDELVEGFAGIIPADKGFIDALRQARLAERHGVLVITSPVESVRSHPQVR